MKKALMKDTVKEIKNTYKRFISILLMAFLGVGFFVGLRASSPDMLHTIDKYFKDTNVYDIEVVSTLGLTQEDVEALKKVENIEEVHGTYTQDALINIEDVESVAKMMCIDDINKPVLKEGRLPENENECVVEDIFLTSNNKKIGDKLEVEMEDTTDDDGEKISFLKQKELEIVGVVNSPLYISRDKGTSKLGAGKVNYFIYVDYKDINAKDVYTEIYMKVKNSNQFVTSSDEYEDYISEVKKNVEAIKEERENARHEMLVDKANEKVDEAQKTFDEEKANAEKEIADAEKKIQDGKAELQKGEEEINKNKTKADKEFASAQRQLDSAKAQLKAGEKELQAKEAEANTQLNEAKNSKAQLQSNLDSVTNGIAQLDKSLGQVIEALKNPNLPAEQKGALEQQKVGMENQRTELENNRQQLQAGIAQIDQGIATGQSELEKGKKTLENSKAEISANEKKLQREKKNAYAQIESAQSKINSSKQELSEGEAELEKSKQEFNEKISDAEGELIDARAKIADIENATWYILDRNANQGHTSFVNDTKSIESLGAVFPLVFFVIATLISLTSMTRMVEEERTQIGTLKALGYSKIQIASKYIIYAVLACVIGGVLGMHVGCAFLPRIVWMMYSMMYTIDNFVVEFNVFYGSIGLTAAIICIVGATIYAAYRELINTPAVLMRPKAPKNGKRVLLERVPFIWKRLSFTRKVTVRNLFRYKKRFLMTIIGILGCTALILVGFGLKDSITSLLPNQFGDIFKYDMQISLKGNLEDSQKTEIIDDLSKKDEVTEIVETYMTSGDMFIGDTDDLSSDNEKEVQIIVPKESNELDKIINLSDVKTHKTVPLAEKEIAITDKLSQLLGVKVGDTVKIRNQDDKVKEFKVANIVSNYVGHYAYMSKDLYEESFEDYETNVLYLKEKDGITTDQEDRLVKGIVDRNEVSSATPTSTVMSSIGDMMNSLNYVVVILIVSAGILAFVVLYNLSNVNISERIRELATIKVLGFYDKEVYNYISRETVILTAIGIILGLVGGYLLNNFILGTCELEYMRFAKTIHPISYVYSVAITIIFTLIVNIVTFFSLKKIDMIESLKSVE